MKNILVIGGGLAGLSAATYLTSKNHKVTLFEASPKLGGRTYSKMYSPGNFIHDNGQHIMMSCYRETFRYLKLIGAESLVETIPGIFIPFIDKNAESFYLQSESNVYPFNLISAIFGYKKLSFFERIGVVRLFAGLLFGSNSNIADITVGEWLKKKKQSKNSIEALWEILAVGTLNTSPEKASAKIFAKVLKEVFLRGTSGYKMVIPKVGLSQLFCERAVKMIAASGTIKTSLKVQEVIFESERAINVVTNKGSFKNFDYIISAVPFFGINRIIPDFFENKNFSPEFSPILSAFIKTDTRKFAHKYYALINSPVHWIFVHEKFISIVISNAADLISEDKNVISNLIIDELCVRFSFFMKSDVKDIVLIKEKRATFVPSPGFECARESFSLPYENFFLAGDWTNTGLPSTIESAVKSGFDAAEKVISAINSKPNYH